MDDQSKMQANPLGDRGKAMEAQWIKQKEKEMAKTQAKKPKEDAPKDSGQQNLDAASWVGM